MPDYKKMYTNLFNKVTDIIEELQNVQKKTEELYIQSSDSEPIVNNQKTTNIPEK